MFFICDDGVFCIGNAKSSIVTSDFSFKMWHKIHCCEAGRACGVCLCSKWQCW